MPEDTESVTLQVDIREQGRILKELEALPGVQIERRELDCGDYVAGELVIERKSSTDFILSIVDKSLYEKAAKLRTRYSHCAYIVEGDLFTRRFHQKAFDVHQAIARLTVLSGIPVLSSPDPEQSALLIYFMAAEAQYRLGCPMDARTAVFDSVTEGQLYFLQGLPGVDAERAERLLEAAGTVSNVLAADHAQWQAQADLDERACAQIDAILKAPWSG